MSLNMSLTMEANGLFKTSCGVSGPRDGAQRHVHVLLTRDLRMLMSTQADALCCSTGLTRKSSMYTVYIFLSGLKCYLD